MTNQIVVGDTLPRLSVTATALMLFRYSAVTWNPHRIHFDEDYAHREGHTGVVVHSHLRAALALRTITEGLGPDWMITNVSYRLRQPAYAPADLSYTARVTESGEESMTLEVLEDHPSGQVGFEGTVTVIRSAGLLQTSNQAPAGRSVGATHFAKEVNNP